MDLLKTKIYLDKLNREYGRLSKDPDYITRIDIDIMASYVRELYDALLSDEVANAAPPQREAAPSRKPVVAKMPEPVEPVAPAPASPPPPAPPPPPREVAPPIATPPPPPPVYEENPAPAAAPPPEPEPQMPPMQASKPTAYSPEAEALFEEKQAKELSEKLSELPISDLRRAIALNDRLLLTRELFSGDGQAFEAAINALNSFSQFEEAKMYMLDQCVIRYGWLDKKRIEAAKNFIKLVRRRYK